MADTVGSRGKVWASLITNTSYLRGFLTLAHSLQRVQTQYPLIALYTDTLPADGIVALHARNIPCHPVPLIRPKCGRTYKADARFNDTWTKLVAFSLVEYERVVLLDSDMVVLRNMDELMDLELDDPALNGDGALVFAATHACACNPLKKAHYPTEWVPENCALTTQHAEPDRAQREGAPASSGVGMLNSGLLVINPSRGIFDKIQAALNEPALVQKYHFPDQGLLSDIFAGRWYPLPYIYNGLRTLRWEGVHSAIWRDEEVKVVHYIFDNKPWLDQRPENGETKEANSLGNGIGNGTSTEPSWKESDAVIHNWWWDIDEDRRRSEHEKGIVNGINGY